jgi:hypothetical protein
VGVPVGGGDVEDETASFLFFGLDDLKEERCLFLDASRLEMNCSGFLTRFFNSRLEFFNEILNFSDFTSFLLNLFRLTARSVSLAE